MEEQEYPSKTPPLPNEDVMKEVFVDIHLPDNQIQHVEHREQTIILENIKQSDEEQTEDKNKLLIRFMKTNLCTLLLFLLNLCLLPYMLVNIENIENTFVRFWIIWNTVMYVQNVLTFVYIWFFVTNKSYLLIANILYKFGVLLYILNVFCFGIIADKKAFEHNVNYKIIILISHLTTFIVQGSLYQLLNFKLEQI
jgi:hypothetical protein